MWGFRKYGKSYIYDRIHRGAVLSLMAVAGFSVIQLGAMSISIYREKKQAASKQLAISESGATGANVKTTGESTT